MPKPLIPYLVPGPSPVALYGVSQGLRGPKTGLARGAEYFLTPCDLPFEEDHPQ